MYSVEKIKPSEGGSKYSEGIESLPQIWFSNPYIFPAHYREP